MSSYTKTLMEQATGWLATNPDPADPFIKIPGFVELREKHERDFERTNGTFRRVVSVLHSAPGAQNPQAQTELLSSLDRMLEINGDIIDRHDKIERDMRDVETGINSVFNGAGKLGEATELNGRFLLAWARDGYNVFELSPDFVAAMLLTDSREIDISRARLPFKGLLMLLPDGFTKDGEGRSYTKIHISELSGREAVMLGAAQEVDKELGKLPPEQAKKFLRQVTKEHNDAAEHNPSWVTNSPTHLTSEPANDRVYIHASNGRWGMFLCAKRDGLTWDKIETEIDAIEDDGDAQAMRTIQMIVFSTLAYISAINGAIEPVEAPKSKRKHAVVEGPKRWTVGRTIKLEPALVRAVRDGSREIAFRLKHRHIVRGHFRNQAHGPNYSLRKEIWISPFWKGPEDGAQLVHTYKPALKTSGDGEPGASNPPGS